MCFEIDAVSQNTRYLSSNKTLWCFNGDTAKGTVRMHALFFRSKKMTEKADEFVA